MTSVTPVSPVRGQAGVTRFLFARNRNGRDNVCMATQPIPDEPWTVREYLSTDWSPDREFVDGRIEERNVGEKEHSQIQGYLTFLFMLKRAEWGVQVFPELRTQIAARNFRVPDVLVLRAGEPFERYLTRPPLIAVEILSSEDRLSNMEKKATEYHRFGIPHIWIIDPQCDRPIASPPQAWKRSRPANSLFRKRRSALIWPKCLPNSTGPES